MIAKNIANKTYKAVYVPDDEDVEIKKRNPYDEINN